MGTSLLLFDVEDINHTYNCFLNLCTDGGGKEFFVFIK